MPQLTPISKVCNDYQISGRTLRYYEEIGILTSHRNENSMYREFDESQLQRLEVILLLRRLSFSIAEIKTIVTSETNTILQEMLHNKQRENSRKQLELAETKELIQTFASAVSNTPLHGINVEQLILNLAYITKKTERVIAVEETKKDTHLILLSIAMFEKNYAMEENIHTQLLPRIKKLRENHPTLPIIRLRDDGNIPDMSAEIIWNGTKVWSRQFADSELNQVVDAVYQQLEQLIL